MPKFFCRHCGFKYSPRSGRTEPPKLCGNCGGNGTVILEPDADQILRESGGMF